MAVTHVSKPKDFASISSGSGYAGTGACFLLNSQGLLVFRVAAPASSAHEAVSSGMLREGDILLKVDGEEMQGRHISEIAKRLLGQPMTTVQLTFQRGHEVVTLNLQRRLSTGSAPLAGTEVDRGSVNGRMPSNTQRLSPQNGVDVGFDTPPFRVDYGRKAY